MIRACGVSETGRVRKTNEDCFVADLRLKLFAVADGMGGHRAGEVASRLAIEAVTEFVDQSSRDPDLAWPFGYDTDQSRAGNRLRNAFGLANQQVFRAARNRVDYAGMGTTLVGALIDGADVAIGSVGDSRAYLLAGAGLEQLTIDDSWTARVLGRDGRLSTAEAAAHPMRHVLTNVIGARDAVDVQVSERTLVPGQVLLLCSDGVHGALPAAAIERVLREAGDVDRAAHQLIEQALEHGTRDNVTALVIGYEAS